jgi:hypothetical protein
MFTFATTVTALGAIAGCSDDGGDVALYGAPCTDADPCGIEQDSGIVGEGDVYTLYGGPPFDAASLEDTGVDAGDATIDDSGDAGEDAD